MIRRAIIKDRDACFDLTKKMYGKFMAEHNIALIDKDLYRTVDYFIAGSKVLVLERDDKVCGMCAWELTPHPANMACKIFQEILWCMDSTHAIDALALLRALQKAALQSKAQVIILVNLALENEPALRRIYGRMGYKYLESHYSRGRV